jgi:cytochrome c oxidase subunit 2
MKRLAIPIVLTIIVSAVFIVLLPGINLTPTLASAEGQVVDDLLNLEFAIIAAIFALCMVFFFYSIIVFRRKKGETGDGEPFHENTPLEIAWTLIPLVLVLGMGVYTGGLLNEITNTEGAELEVNVTASQWSWSFEYPDSEIVTTELVLPVDQKVLFTFESTDVIHSFWVPEFRLKQDVVPGIETQLVVTPNEVGEYKVRCAEICGLQHAYMLAPVRVLEAGEYEAWVAENSAQELPEDPVARGEIWATQFGCIACHSIDGSVVVGPSWQGVYGSEEALDDGTTATVDDEYLRESIMDPSAQLVDGFADAMPKDFGERMSEEQIDDVIAYIASLAE